MTTRRTFVIAAITAAAASAACTPMPALATGQLVDMQIVDRTRGDTLSTWRARGASWVAGRPGDRYAVRLTNRTGARVLVVLSVDGVNAISGETASTGQTGYVLAPWQTTEITGWRKSWQEAAAFYFTSLPDSYAARTDRPDNVGVIGAAVFRERVVYQPPRVLPAPPVARNGYGSDDRSQRAERRDSEPQPSADASGSATRQGPAAASPAPRDRAPMESKKAEKLGTGHGEREYSPTTQTAFERASSNPAEVVQVRYDSWANLSAAGIVPTPRPRAPFAPEPFPAFAPDPRG